VAIDNSNRGIRLRRLRLTGASGGSDRVYGVSFLDQNGESFRPLSVIAGPSQTGKTSIIDFVRYCLGDESHPQHPEIITYVRDAMLESVLAGTITTIERSATGQSSKFASVWEAPLGRLRNAKELRIPTEPSSDPQSLSQFVLAACGLDNVELPEAPTKSESRTQMLSIRDLFHIMCLPNERLDNKNLLYEANFMVRQKLVQTIDVVFDVHDAAGTDLAAKARRAADAAREASRLAASLREVVQAEHPLGPLALEGDRDRAEREVRELSAQLAELDRHQMSTETTLTMVRQRFEEAQVSARAAAVRVRNRESLMERLTALRGQYADDKKKLAFLKDAERLFNPLQVTVCPACLSKLSVAPSVIQGKCSLCGHQLPDDINALSIGDVSDRHDSVDKDDAGESGDEENIIALLEAEHRAASRRLDELTGYWNRLDDDLRTLRAARTAADEGLAQASDALNRATDVPAPYIAARDDLDGRRSEALLRLQTARAGLRLWGRVQSAQDNADRLTGHATLLRNQRREASRRPDRREVIRQLSERFGIILSDIGYPKLSHPYLNDNLRPSVRNLPYTSASSGGLVLISLAWYLALWEISYEQAPYAPGLLMIDSPQKNLGQAAHQDDPDFADTRLVENFYLHVRRWLAGEGSGAQLVVVDNSPPEIVSNDVVVRYTRNRDVPPYGLIDNAVD
jgi:AAA domain